MEDDRAMEVMSALSHRSRVTVVRALAREAPAGISAGELAALAGLSRSAMSPNLAILARAGLVQSVQSGRNVIFRLRPSAIGDLAAWLSDLDAAAERPASG